ncbi:MAG: TonB-dependent receptor [Prolixibacteraceae bacterium]|nr:TonB-dependent receptor [Prolixibacteraceae bacterium]
MKQKVLLLLMLSVLWGIGYAQQHTVTGTVTSADDNTPLPGVSIAVKGTTTGTITDIDGNYSIAVKDENATLMYVFVGMRTVEIPIAGQNQINVAMETDVMGVDEVVVVGYGVTKKSLVTGSIAKVDAEDIMQSRTTRVENALQGKTAGVLVQQSSGAPGAEQNIIIRGVGSDNAVRPIYVIDGMRTDGIDWLDPQDIESIEILKDAASAAIYGTEGGNGVVLITTKMGKGGKTNFSYDASYGIQSVVPGFSVMDTEEYLKYYRTAYVNDGRNKTWDDAVENYPDSDVNTDWLGAIFVNAPTQKHKISVDGGSDRSKYYFSVSYTDQDGIIGGGEKSNFTRYATKLNIDSKATDWMNVGMRMSYSQTRTRGIHQNDVFGSVTNNAVVLDPTTPVYYNDRSEYSDRDVENMSRVWGEEWYTNPSLYDENGYFGISQKVLNEIQNPVHQLHNDRDQSINNKLFGGIYGEINFFEGLKFRTNFDIDLAHNYNRGWNPRVYTNSMNSPSVRSRAFQEINMYFTWQWESYFTFNKEFGDHTIGAVLGTSAREYTHEYLGGDGENLKKESDNYAWIDYGLYIDTLNNTSWGGLGGWDRLASVFGRVSYSYKDKYMITSNFRRDGSSKFGPANKFGLFPSVSVGWVMSREDFFQVPAISFLKLRYSWGKNGNATSLGWDWRYLPTSSSGSYYYIDGNDQLLSIVEPTRLTNPEYQWEKTEQSDIGIDLGLFRNRLSFTADYYIKKSSDFLFEGSVPALAGNDPPTVNAGTIENRGIEFELGYNDKIGDLKINVQLTASHNKSEVTEITETISFITGGNVGTFGDSKRMEVGYEPWYFYGFKTDGLFQSEEEIEAYVNADGKKYQTSAAPGDVKYLDIAGTADSLGGGPDGLLTDADKTYLGSPYPKLLGGLNINLEYKGFDLNVATYGQYGNKVLMAVSVRDDLSNTNKPDFYINDAWISPEEPGTFPRPTVKDRNRNLSRVNDYMLQDGSFFRISNLALGYTLPSSLTSKIGISKLRIYVAVDNLYTLTNYKGMEPEVGGDYWGYRGQQWAGIDRAVYPKPRTVLGGINVNF